MMKTTVLTAVVSLALSYAAQAQDQQPAIAEDQLLVMACLEAMEQSTSWGQCVNLMFEPCADQPVGTQAHASCLEGVRGDWAATGQLLQAQVMEAVTPQAQTEILDLMRQWTSFVVQKCTEVAASKPTGAESARLGCEVSEIAGLSAEFAACLEGRSTAEYCQIKE